ncbi:hypothetical protein SARC_00007 [Sphaeroforma arctica JP610]|uniref:Uncharacterized protein n=1 Tax=Sphaeroforma arctica JP610 TaxID=667725 RepID=A0A0L0GHP5_9EUKA|nr:hypothetical protein SARC_00007 [Sphaeroforma arctica JP610]KNC87873.1 hypothetical protein SARC_00007 [Sphaeroforma arctica JP610]|eukprot:XP_014161775.1 hypothetical protein SARC_00007 [Sphaeroforma arctica JP610]
MYSYVESEYWEDAHGFFERDINVFSRSLKDRSQLGAGGISGTSNGNIFAREEIGKEDVGATGGVNSAMLGGTDFSPERIGNEDAVGIAWRELAVETKKAYIQSLLDRLCDGNRKVCTDALGALQYLCQGNYGNRCEAVRKDVGPDGVVEARKRNEQAVLAELKANAKVGGLSTTLKGAAAKKGWLRTSQFSPEVYTHPLLFSLDTISHVMWCLCQQLKDRLQSQTSHNPGSPPHSRKQSHTQSQETHGPKATKESRRSIGSKAGVRKGLGGLGMRRGLNVVCTIVLVHTYECDTDTRRRFRAYLESPMSFSRDCLLMSVYSLVLQFGQPAVTHLPINKLLLLLKTVLDALVDGRGVEGQETQYNAHARELAHEDVCTCTPHESVQEENSESGAVHTKPPTETHASATTNSYGYNDAERRVEVNTRRQLQALATEKPIGPVTRHEGSQAELKNKAQTELKPQPQAERKNQPQSLASTDTKLGKDEVSNLNTGSAECSPPSLTQTSAQTRTNTSTHGPEHPHSHSHSAIREATKESTPGSDNGTAMHKPTTTTKPVHAPPPKPPAYKRRPKASSESKTGTGEVPKIVPDSVLPAEARVDAEDRLKGLQRSVTQPNMRTGMGWADGGGRLDRPAEREGGRDTGSTGIGHGEKLMENRGELMSRNDIDSVRGSSGHLAPIGTGEWVQGSSGKLTDTARAVKEGVSISTELTGEKCETDRNRLTGRKSAAELDRDGEPAGEEGSNGLATDDAPNAGNGNSTQVVADKIVEDKSSPGDSRVSDRSPGDSRVSDRSPYVSRKRGRAHMHTQPSVAPPSFPIRPTETDCGSDTCVAAAESETSEGENAGIE